MMSRLMLNLHRTAAQQPGDTTMDPNSMNTGTLQFTTRIGVSASMFDPAHGSSDSNSTNSTHVQGQTLNQISDMPPIVEVSEKADVDAKSGFISAVASPV